MLDLTDVFIGQVGTDSPSANKRKTLILITIGSHKERTKERYNTMLKGNSYPLMWFLHQIQTSIKVYLFILDVKIICLKNSRATFNV